MKHCDEVAFQHICIDRLYIGVLIGNKKLDVMQAHFTAVLHSTEIIRNVMPTLFFKEQIGICNVLTLRQIN